MIGWCWPVLTSIGPTLTQHSVCLLNCFGIQVVGIYIEGWGMFCVNSRLHTMSVVYNPNWTEILSHVNPRFHTLSVMLESGITMRRFSPCMWWWKKLLLCKMSCGKNVHATVNLHNWTTRRQMVEVSHRTNTTQANFGQIHTRESWRSFSIFTIQHTPDVMLRTTTFEQINPVLPNSRQLCIMVGEKPLWIQMTLTFKVILHYYW